MAIPHYDRNFKGAIALANWVKSEHWYAAVAYGVTIDMGSVWPAFKNAVQKERGKFIELHYVDYLSTTSICLEREKKFEILIPKSFNTCHRRFALCKELCHILTDDASVKCHAPVDQINVAIRTGQHVRNAPRDGELSPLFTEIQLASEHFCFLLAVEILIPVAHRENIIRDVKISGKKTIEVATELKIPQSLVQFFIESQYHTEWKRHGGETLLLLPPRRK